MGVNFEASMRLATVMHFIMYYDIIIFAILIDVSRRGSYVWNRMGGG